MSELPNVWVVIVDGEDDIAGASCFQAAAENIALEYEPEYEGDPEPEVHEYVPAAKLAAAESDLAALRAAVAKAVMALCEWSINAEGDIMRLDEYCTSTVDAVAKDLETALGEKTDG